MNRSVCHQPASADAAADELARLVASIARGDSTALAELYERTVARLYGLAHAILSNAADAEETVCDVYVQVWRRAGDFDPQRGSVMSWLLITCRTRAIDVLRKRRAHERLQMTDAELDEPFRQFEEHAAVRVALARLPALRRRLVMLSFFRGLSHGEIAGLLDLPLGTVKSHLRRALLSLREMLEQ